MSFLKLGQFAWMAYSRCDLTNAQYRGTKISFVRRVNDLFVKYSIPLALLAAVRTFAEGVNADFTVMQEVISASICLPPLQIGLDDDREGLLLIDDGFYLRLTEETNHVLVELMTSARVAVFLKR